MEEKTQHEINMLFARALFDIESFRWIDKEDLNELKKNYK